MYPRIPKHQYIVCLPRCYWTLHQTQRPAAVRVLLSAAKDCSVHQVIISTTDGISAYDSGWRMAGIGILCSSFGYQLGCDFSVCEGAKHYLSERCETLNNEQEDQNSGALVDSADEITDYICNSSFCREGRWLVLDTFRYWLAGFSQIAGTNARFNAAGHRAMSYDPAICSAGSHG